MHEGPPAITAAFSGTQVTDDGQGPTLLSHRQRLLVVAGPDRGLSREIAATHVRIGTGTANDVVLSDPAVSRAHCEISVRDDAYVLRDLGSTNGTRLNGTPVMEAIVTPGARIRVGETELVFQPKRKWERIAASERRHLGDLVGESQAIRSVFDLLAKVAGTELSVLLVGETGTGKELAARALHGASARAEGPFVVVDCAAVSETLVESELFGHEKGAFTGADRAREGSFERAQGGTIFLDEIGELPLALQKKLLRVLEQREVRRLGASDYVEVNVRVVAATHRDVHAMTKAGEFREDLLYRLAEVVVPIPPLRERPHDVPIVSEHILAQVQAREPGASGKTLHADAIELLESYEWPGNGRELRNVLRRAAALASGPVITAADLRAVGFGAPHAGTTAPPPPMTLGPAPRVGGAPPEPAPGDAQPLTLKEARERAMPQVEKAYLEQLLARHSGDLDAAAREAGLHRKTLVRMLTHYGLKARRGSGSRA